MSHFTLLIIVIGAEAPGGAMALVLSAGASQPQAAPAGHLT